MARRKNSLLGLTADTPAVPFNPDTMDEDNALPPLEDDPADDIIGSLNDPRRENLSQYEPSPVTGGMSSGSGGFYGGDEGQVIGRPVTPKIWANAQLHPSVVQLRVWKKTNGVPVLIGTIDAHATEEEFIRTFFDVMPAPGEGQAVFVVRPVDREGREIREEVTLPPISEYHTILKAMRTSRAAAAAAGISVTPYAPVPSMPPELLKLVERAQEAADARTRIMEEELRSARDLAIKAQEQAAQERIDLASRTAMSVEAITERMMKQESERTQKALDAEKMRADQQQTALTSMFTQMQVMMQQAQEREREAFDRRLREDESRREREQREYERRMTEGQREAEAKREREREEWERKSRVEKDEAERREREREAERTRQHDLRMREMETSAQRDREHAERMIELTKMREKGESIEGTIEKTTKVLGMLGVNPVDLISKVMGKKGDEDEEGGGGAAGVMAAIAPLLGEGAKVLGEVMKANAQARGQQARMMGPGGFAPGYGAPQGYPQQGYPQQPMMLPPPPPQPLAAAEMGSYQQPQYAPPQPMQQQPMQQQAPAPQAAPAAPAGPQSSLPLPVQRSARTALRNLVKTLKSTQREGWEDAITFAIASELSIYQYVNDVSVRAALLEAGADEPFTAQIIESLRASDKVPNDLPYGDGR
jgi:hypothetical protein